MSPAIPERKSSRTLRAFLFGFSYYGVLKIRFVLSRIFGDVLYQFSYNPGFLLKRDAVKADQFVLKFANWLRSKYGRRPETVRGVGLIDPEIVFVSRREDVAERIRMEPKYVPGRKLWINPSLPTLT